MAKKRIQLETHGQVCGPKTTIYAEDRRNGVDLYSEVPCPGETTIPLTPVCDENDVEQAFIILGEKIKVDAEFLSVTYDEANKTVIYTPNTPTPQDVQITAVQRSPDPDLPVTTVAPGGTFPIPAISLLDSADVVQELILYGETVKMMTAYDSITVVGNQVQIVGSGVTIEADQRTGPNAAVGTEAPSATYVVPMEQILDPVDALVSEIQLGESVKMMSANITHNLVGSQHQFTGPAQADIAYKWVAPNQYTSFRTGDSGWHVQNNADFEYASPAYPTAVMCLDHDAEQSAVRLTPASGTRATDKVYPTVLTENNRFGNKLRFTDSLGNGSDATVGTNIYAHIDWRNHSFTGALSNYVIDHLLGIGMYVHYWTSDTSGGVPSGLIHMATTSSLGMSWEQWVDHIHAVTIVGFDDWWLPFTEIHHASALGAATKNLVWAQNFFTGHNSPTRFYSITSDTVPNSTTNCYLGGDSANGVSPITSLSKAITGSFGHRIAACFPFRIDR